MTNIPATPATVERSDAARSTPRLVVGVGASAGGLEALQDFLEAVPVDGGVAYVLVTHRHPQGASLLPDLLARHTPMPVAEATDGVELRPDHVYISPSQGELRVEEGRLRVAEGTMAAHQLPIDRFLRSLSEAYGRHAVCVILSGSGTDGAIGLETVKANLGLVLAQSPETAAYGGMPSSAIATRHVDHVLPPDAMPPVVTAYADALADGPELATGDAEDRSAGSYRRILRYLRAQTGHDFSAYKPSTIQRRIDRRMRLRRLEDVEGYLDFIARTPSELDTLVQDLLIGVTAFFRDPDAFDALAREALPTLLQQGDERQPVRVWVAGCATGEEAYSLAILLRETMDELGVRRDVQIFATDVDPRAIETARAGRYPTGIADDVSADRLERFFVREQEHYRIADEIREMVIFATQNVITDPPFTRLDLLSCRNLLIYLENDTQERVVRLLHYALAPNGVLFLGSAESLGSHADGFEPLSKEHRIFQRCSGTLGPWPQQQPHTPVPAEPSRVSAEPARTRTQSISQLAERVLNESLVPPTVLVDGDGDILHVHGRTGAFLEPSEGEPYLNVLRMAREDLRIELPAALRRAVREGTTVVRRALPLTTDGRATAVDLTVTPVRRPTSARGYYLVTFSEREPPEPSEEATERTSDHLATSEREELEQELRSTKETLQATIEQYETANEELKSSNEELQSTNEELQSTNEELETTKEEQQSLNEELQTVNAELQDKMAHLQRAHDDMRNLLDSTESATLFLDSQLRIKRFTPEMRHIANVLDSDVGRPIGDLAMSLRYDGLAADAAKVLRTLVYERRTVEADDGTWYRVSIVPYRTVQDVIDGVVLTFLDVTELEGTRTRLERAQRSVEEMVKLLPNPALLLDGELRVLVANEAAARAADTAPSLDGRSVQRLGEPFASRPVLELLEDRLPADGTEETAPVPPETEGHDHTIIAAARRLDAPGDPPGRVLIRLVESGDGPDEARAR